MNHRVVTRFLLPVLAFLSCASVGLSQAPLPVDGTISDRSTYSAAVWFRVPSTVGYTYAVLLDGKLVPTDVTNTVDVADYHEVSVTRTNVATLAVTNRVIRFIIQSDRGAPEKGLIKWTPYPPIPSTAAEFAGARLNLAAPEFYPVGLPIPVVFWVDDAQGQARRANGLVTAAQLPQGIEIRRGHGSGFLPAANSPGTIGFYPQLTVLQTDKDIEIEADTVWTVPPANIVGAVDWPANSRIHLTANLTIASGATLNIGAGTVVKLSPLVNIDNGGSIVIQGTRTQPVVFTATNSVLPEVRTHAWGGFLMRSSASRIEATSTFFVGGGGAASFSFSPGSSHRSEQAVFLLQNGAHANLTNCYTINTAGQFGNGYNADLTLDHCLVHRAITAGEYVNGTIIVKNTAIIEFPADDGIITPAAADADYDGIYFTEGTHILENSLFGYCKDDAIDSGSGGAGTVLVTNCWVESALHEALAWSGTGRQTWTLDTVLMNSGQGIECGWSSSDGSPNCFADRLLSTGNSIGARFGDNYDWDYWGTLRVTNSLILNNYRDMWGMNWDNWLYGIKTPSGPFMMDLQSNYVTQPNPRHPNNNLWNPGTDAWRLTNFTTIPADAPVGIGLAYRTNLLAMTSLIEGVPVRLSTLTTNFVSVGYTFEDPSEITLDTGTLTFAPGETVKRIIPAGFNARQFASVRVSLNSPVNGELTGRTLATFSGSLPSVVMSLAVNTNLLPSYRLSEGAFLRLSSPATEAVRVSYAFTAGGVTLETGTFTIPPLEMSGSLFLTAANAYDYTLVTLSLSNAVGAVWSGATSVSYTNPPLTMAFGVVGAQLDLATLSNGVPVGLSSPAPGGVSVDFVFEGNGGVLTNGTLVFGAGQSAVALVAPTIDAAQHDVIRVSLSRAVGATLGGVNPVYYVRTLPVLPPPPNVTLIGRGAASRWRYRDAASAAPVNWMSNSFDHSTWLEGPAQLGFSGGEEGDEATLIADNNQITSYFRRYFMVTNTAAFTNLYLWLLRDDGGVVYLNGREVFRSPNLPAYPAAISYSTTTSSPNGENTIDTAVVSAGYLQAGSNLCAVEIHQQSATSSDVSFDLELVGYSAPVPAAEQELYYAQMGVELVMAWNVGGYVLEVAETLAGPWDVAAGTSPLVLTPDGGTRFYRLRKL